MPRLYAVMFLQFLRFSKPIMSISEFSHLSSSIIESKYETLETKGLFKMRTCPLLTTANEGASLPHPSHMPFEVVPHPICSKTASNHRGNTASNDAMVSSGTVLYYPIT